MGLPIRILQPLVVLAAWWFAPATWRYFLQWLAVMVLTYVAGHYRLLAWFHVMLGAPFSKVGGYTELSHVFLNMQTQASWINLGLWNPIDIPHTVGIGQPCLLRKRIKGDVPPTYSEACDALATKVGDQAGLQANSKLLDVGFGRGDQLFLWWNRFKVSEIHGINASESEVSFFHAKLRARMTRADAHTQPNIQAVVGSATALPAWVEPGTYTHVIALDCAYHFVPSREEFFQQACRALRPGGR